MEGFRVNGLLLIRSYVPRPFAEERSRVVELEMQDVQVVRKKENRLRGETVVNPSSHHISQGSWRTYRSEAW